ncbi:MAG: DoxX family protein [Candidatus Neomarinimicrobiota bacterium]|nr:DoxX family protein [Candidatus Neomarinimicrobiota bacterium]
MPNAIQGLLENRRDAGLLLLRIFSGYLMVVNHGYGKITQGPERWEGLGGAMERLGIDFFPIFWGFMASFSESICAVLLIVGLFTLPASFLLSVTMFVAAYGHVVTGKGSPELAFVYGAIFMTIMFIGPGRYSLDRKFFPHLT